MQSRSVVLKFRVRECSIKRRYDPVCENEARRDLARFCDGKRTSKFPQLLSAKLVLPGEAQAIKDP